MAERISASKRPHFKDLTGATFNGLTALHVVGPGTDRKYLWRWRCRCGVHFTARGADVRRGKTTSCGCYNLAMLRSPETKHRTHGRTRGPEYNVWRAMKARCANPRGWSYAGYGARGIEVCERWRDSFEAFLADMGPRPSMGHSIDRIDNALGYSPDNCRWATTREQLNNKRNNLLLTFQGRTLNLTQWSEELGIKKATIHKRLTCYGWSVEEALGTPPRVNSAALAQEEGGRPSGPRGPAPETPR